MAITNNDFGLFSNSSGGGGGGGVSSVTGTAPISSSGGANPAISISQSSGSANGFLSSTDWTTFNNKFDLPSLTSGSVLFSNGTTISQNNNNIFWDNTNLRLGLKTIPQVTLHVGNAGGTMAFPYEEAVIEKTFDTKFGIYTSANTPSEGGSSITIGYTKFKTSTGFYPHFEFQIVGNDNEADNKVRYNFLLRGDNGIVLQNNDDIFNIFGDGRVSFQKLIGGLASYNEIVVGDSLGFITKPSNIATLPPFNYSIPTIKLEFDTTISTLLFQTDLTIGIMQFETTSLVFTGSSLERNTSGAGGANYLIVTVNNIAYTIEMKAI